MGAYTFGEQINYTFLSAPVNEFTENHVYKIVKNSHVFIIIYTEIKKNIGKLKIALIYHPSFD